MAASAIKVKNVVPIRNEGRALGYFNVMPKYVDIFHETAAAVESYAVPAGITLLHIRSDVNCYLQTNGGTAAAPTANVTDGSGVTILFGSTDGLWWSVDSGDVLSISITGAGNVYIEGWA